jgi:hypothetical protein
MVVSIAIHEPSLLNLLATTKAALTLKGDPLLPDLGRSVDFRF